MCCCMCKKKNVEITGKMFIFFLSFVSASLHSGIPEMLRSVLFGCKTAASSQNKVMSATWRERQTSGKPIEVGIEL